MSVDRKSHLAAGASRDSVRLMSTDTYDAGNLIIIDLKHVPYGCGVWPAFWTFKYVRTVVVRTRCLGADSQLSRSWPWPSYGEIDVYEGINDRSFNQMTLREHGGLSSRSTARLADRLREICRHGGELHSQRCADRQHAVG